MGPIALRTSIQSLSHRRRHRWALIQEEGCRHRRCKTVRLHPHKCRPTQCHSSMNQKRRYRQCRSHPHTPGNRCLNNSRPRHWQIVSRPENRHRKARLSLQFSGHTYSLFSLQATQTTKEVSSRSPVVKELPGNWRVYESAGLEDPVFDAENPLRLVKDRLPSTRNHSTERRSKVEKV